MLKIANFEQLRADGNVIPVGMTVREMLARGWGPSKVIELRWSYEDRMIEYAAPKGVLAIPVRGGNFVAAIVDQDSSGVNTRLVVFLPDGSRHGVLENRVRTTVGDLNGMYGWFEDPLNAGDDKFGVVFQTEMAGDFRCDIDARDLRVLAVERLR